jgi:hypothetical protein
MIAPDLLLHGVVLLAIDLAWREVDEARVAVAQFALALLDIGNRGLVHQHDVEGEIFAVAQGLADHALGKVAPVVGGDGLRRMVVGDRLHQEATHAVLGKNLVLRAIDLDDLIGGEGVALGIDLATKVFVDS